MNIHHPFHPQIICAWDFGCDVSRTVLVVVVVAPFVFVDRVLVRS